jgi:hypothetical protein
MALAGRGAVAIWHDITGEGRAEFYAWHGNEHMRERVEVPGFLRGRRYVAVNGAPEYFNLYETESPATVTSAAYLDRLNHPTPWTRATVPHFRDVSRSLCEVAASYGPAQGGLIGTFRYALPAGRDGAHRKRMATGVLPTLAHCAGVAGCHLLVADEAASAIKTAEKNVRAGANKVPPWIVLIEGWGDEPDFELFCRSILLDDIFADAETSPELGIYRLQCAVDKSDHR